MLLVVVVLGINIKKGTVPLYNCGNPPVMASTAFGTKAPVNSRLANILYITKLMVPDTHEVPSVSDWIDLIPVSPACKPKGKKEPAAGELAVGNHKPALLDPVPD